MTIPRRLVPSLIFTLSLCLLRPCAAHAAGDPPAMTRALDHILAAPVLHGGITGAIVERVSDGHILYAHDADIRLLPASNRKLFTSAAALELLGDDFTYKTEVLATAKPNADGTLHGDLILKGVGDSSLKTADIDDLAAQVAKAGVKQVTGNVIGDGSAFTDGPYGFGWEWDDFGDSEFAQIAGLEANDGDVRAHAQGGKYPGDPVIVTLDPPVAWPRVVNTALTETSSPSSSLDIDRPYGTNIITMKGSLPPDGKINQDVPVPDPPRYAAQIFAQALAAHGVQVSGLVVSGPTTGASVVLATHTSVPLTAYIALMNKPSDNLLAESLIRTLGLIKGKGGNYDAGHEVEMPFYKSLGVDTGEIALVDGCGVGRRNFVTARTVGQLLLGMHREPDWKYYYNSLPIAGVDGTLARRMKGTRAADNVHAKTGTLSQVRALSGYITGRGGHLYLFSLLMNNYSGKASTAGHVQDEFVEYLADHL